MCQSYSRLEITRGLRKRTMLMSENCPDRWALGACQLRVVLAYYDAGSCRALSGSFFMMLVLQKLQHLSGLQDVLRL